MILESLINQLAQSEQKIFKKLCAGSFAKKIYRMYEYIIAPEK